MCLHRLSFQGQSGQRRDCCLSSCHEQILLQLALHTHSGNKLFLLRTGYPKRQGFNKINPLTWEGLEHACTAWMFVRAAGAGGVPRGSAAAGSSDPRPGCSAFHSHGHRFVQLLEKMQPDFWPSGRGDGEGIKPAFMTAQRLETLKQKSCLLVPASLQGD